MKPLPPGLYDLLITRAVQDRLAETQLADWKSSTEALEEPELPAYLSRYLAKQVRSVLSGLTLEQQVSLANELLGLARLRDGARDGSNVVPAAPEVLKAVFRHPPPPAPPRIPLSASDLLMNTVGAPRLGYELESEMRNADRVCVVMSFIQWRGWQRLRPGFEELSGRGCPVRILTTTYIGATDLAALQAMAQLPGVEVRVSLDGRRRRLHAKAWLFERDSGFGSVYVGSANLSRPALEDGIEWTVKLSQAEAPHIVEKFLGAFETLWRDVEFERFDPADPACVARVREALGVARNGVGETRPMVFFDLAPHPYQQAVLDRLEAERQDRKHYRNLVVAPTGTGKTMIAAFDYARQPYSGRRPRLLFLAHRVELLEQARGMFRAVLRDASFGEVLAGNEPTSFEHLFATVASFNSRELLSEFGAEYWSYAVLDEAHHAPAESYAPLLGTLRPGILLGLTATPERMDGQSILPWFDDRIADEMRLWHAIERQYVVPFDYYGIADGTPLNEVGWRRGGYDVKELEGLYVGNQRRAELVLQHVVDLSGNIGDVRALGFCVSVAHAEFMAEVFRRAGVAALALTSRSGEEERRSAPQRLRSREINVLFTVDLFNEGVDIPEVDCVLFLRPTESATIFLQQLGRGLRLKAGKTSCLVLDFIGNQHREFRFDLRYRALLGGTRQQVAAGIEMGAPPLPGNCYFRLDRETQKVVLENLRQRLTTSRARLSREVASVARELGRAPALGEFCAETACQLEDLYKGRIGWSQLLFDAGLIEFPLTPEEERLSCRLDRLLHVDAVARLKLYQELVTGSRGLEGLNEAERRQVLMLSFRLSAPNAAPKHWAEAVTMLSASAVVSREFYQFCDALRDRVPTHEEEDPGYGGWPLFLHRRYKRDEVLVAVGAWTIEAQPPSREGPYRLPQANTELFFVTLDKSAKHFSPTTRYHDYALSPTQFHWQSQSTTSEESEVGLRYQNQASNGWTFLLFVRERPGDAYIYVGPVIYASHQGSRPMSIIWNLAVPLPAAIFELFASLRTV